MNPLLYNEFMNITTLTTTPTALPSHFLRNAIEHDLKNQTYASRRWAGSPGDQSHHDGAPVDWAKIRTRFPPEPNGYLHIGHAKSICINFGLANQYGGVCHLRLDDTNPEKEEIEYANAIVEAVEWLGFNWQKNGTSHLYHASDYFEFMYQAAVHLIERGLAYVDEQTTEKMRDNRGDFGRSGTNSPYRELSIEHHLTRFSAMREGQFADGSMVLRAKIDMAHANINLRDPALYRIRHATHHRTGNAWCIYPMYTYAHPIEDALEQITHSICTLEFEDQRPWYDWLLARLVEGGLLPSTPPRQYEFSRLNLTHVLTSKRKLKQLVDDGHVQGWDDPRMPTVVGLRRRGYTPESLRLFIERIGVTKSDSWIDYGTLEGCLRETLDATAPRAMAVLNPIELHLTNWREIFGDATVDACTAAVHPHNPEQGERVFNLSEYIWIERSDFEINPQKGFFRLQVGKQVRLKYGHIVECTGYKLNADGAVIQVQAAIVPDTKSGTPGSGRIKVKGVVTWVSVTQGLPATVRLYSHLFTEAQPDSDGKNFLEHLNPNSMQTVQAWVEPSMRHATTTQPVQFERHGYFAIDRVDSNANALVFNLATGLKDSHKSA